jgi:hypothetical protein
MMITPSIPDEYADFEILFLAIFFSFSRYFLRGYTYINLPSSIIFLKIERYGVYDKLSDFLLLECPHIRTYPAREARKTCLLSLGRVRAYYKSVPETRFNALPKQSEADLFTALIARAIAALVQGPTASRQQKAALTQRRRTVKRAVVLIERWRLYLAGVIGSKRFLEMWNYLYPYFKKNAAEGYFPISSNVLKKAHKNYERWILPFLRKIGYLERAPYKYSSVYGVCYYYKINGFPFIKDAPPPAPEPKRVSKAQTRAAQIRAYKRDHPKATVRHIGEVFKCSIGLVSKYLNDK